ncbi:single hybrid motif-containing protein [Mycena capillaripes]|nr:single hybrid motif-containing protein [Mycena capillaripes]
MMPALSPFMTQGTISRWFKKEGEEFRSGDILLEIESEYATINVEALNSGILGKILSPDGSTNVPVEQVIALVAKTPQEMVRMQAPAHMPPPTPPLATPTHHRAGLEQAKGLMMASVHRTPSAFEIHDAVHPSGAATVRGIVMDHARPQDTPVAAPSADTGPPDESDDQAALLRKTIVSTLSRRGSGAKSSRSTKCTTAQYFDGIL